MRHTRRLLFTCLFVAVAALTAQNDLAYFSSFGRNSVHIAAPGHNILSTIKGGGYEVMSGTSMATPHVSGTLAIARGYFPAISHHHPLIEDWEGMLLASTEDIDTNVIYISSNY